MNDGERDAWLREALRHAPDAGALPPRGISDAILAEARAAVRPAPQPPRRVGVARSVADFWAWLARPPIAAGFASVMVATLVGLMWWDRPIDETSPPPPASTRLDVEPSPARPQPAPAAAPAATTAPAAEAATTAPAAQALNEATAPPPRDALSENRERKAERRVAAAPPLASPQPAPAREPTEDAKVVAKSASPGRDGENSAKERSAGTGRDEAGPSAESAAAARVSPGATGLDAAKKTEDAVSSRSPAAPAPKPFAAAPAPARAVPDAGADIPAQNVAKGAPAPAAPPAEAARRQRAFGELRDKDAQGQTPSAAAAPSLSPSPSPSASPAPSPFRGQGERARAEAAPTSPLAAVLAAIAAEPERWSRRTAAGDAFALDAGWRAWLLELDAAAAGRWIRFGDQATPAPFAAPSGGAAPTTLRLVSGGHLAATVRLAGATLQVETDGGQRWQATLDAAAAERLSATARRLSP